MARNKIEIEARMIGDVAFAPNFDILILVNTKKTSSLFQAFERFSRLNLGLVKFFIILVITFVSVQINNGRLPVLLLM